MASTTRSTSLPPFPVSGVIGIVKPSGPTSMSLLDKLKPLLASSSVFRDPSSSAPQQKKRKRRGESGATPKIGQGGTLDPLADGVLVIGIGAGTKRLQTFIECSKEYRTIGLLGSSTLSYDSQEPILQRTSSEHVSEQDVREAVETFKGKQEQLPPLYSSIRIDGKRLFDYAREGVDLPRPVERRAVEVYDIRLHRWLPTGEHAYTHPTQACSSDERKVAMRARRLAGLEKSTGEEEEVEQEQAGSLAAEEAASSSSSSAAFELDMTVSSGTYVRSIVHDVGAKLHSSAHVVKLTRLRQGQWVVPAYDGLGVELDTREAVPWSVLQRAIDAHHARSKRSKVDDGRQVGENAEDDVAEVVDEEHADENGLYEWERILLAK